MLTANTCLLILALVAQGQAQPEDEDPTELHWVGCGYATEYSKFDSEKRGLIINIDEPFPVPGNVTQMRFIAGGTDAEDRCAEFDNAKCWEGRRLWVGVFRRVDSDSGCGQFQLVARRRWRVQDGLNLVEFRKPISVQSGDCYGFYWFRYGAVSWEPRDVEDGKVCYCRGENKARRGGRVGRPGSVVTTYEIPAAGEDVTEDAWGTKYAPSYRKYALEAYFIPDY